jgi:hypothetical protein
MLIRFPFPALIHGSEAAKENLRISVLFNFFVDLGARRGTAIRKILLGQSESVTLMETGKVSHDCVSAARAGSFCDILSG